MSNAIHSSSEFTNVLSADIGAPPSPDHSSKSPTLYGVLFGSCIKAIFLSSSARQANKAASKEVASEELFSTPSLNSHSTDTPPRVSLKEQFKSLFFGTSKSKDSETTVGKKTSLLSWLSSKIFTPAPKKVIFGKDDSGKDIKIPEHGSVELSSENHPNQIDAINQSLNIEEIRNINDFLTFDNDAGRENSHTFKSGKTIVSSKGMPKITNVEKTLRINRAKQVLDEISLSFSDTLECNQNHLNNLRDDLRLLNAQGLVAGLPLLFASKEHAPENCFFPMGGIVANFIYTKTADREITITAKGTISSSAQSSNLVGKLNGEIVMPFSDNQTTTGGLDMVLKAQIGDDGHITSLTCHSAKVSYQIHDKIPLSTS